MALHKLVVISLDSMGFRDLDELREFVPHLDQFIKRGTWVKRVKGIFPTLTYPSHTSIITGQYPAIHGIVNNTKIQPQRESPDWYWYRKDIKAMPLYDVAREAGLTTAAFLWPVTAGTIINKRPDLTLIHLVDMDSMRHRNGVRSPQAKAALQRLDRRVAKIIQASRDAGTYDDTDFVILGDHYQINVDKMIHLNMVFANQGLLTPIKGKSTYKNNWRVTAKTCDGETYIYTKGYVDLNKLKQLIAGVEGVERIYSGAEAVKLGADPKCSFLVEAKPGYYFTDEVNRPAIVEKVDPKSLGTHDRYRAVHGYGPNQPNYFTTAIFVGPSINQGKEVATAHLVDEGPTFAKILGLHYPAPTAGQVIPGVVKSEVK